MTTTSFGACFASIEASRSLHRFRESFHLQRNSLPCAMAASVEEMELPWKKWKASISMGLEAFVDVSYRTISTSAEASKGCVHFHGLPYGSTYFHLRPLRPTNFDVLAVLPLASKRFRALKFLHAITCLLYTSPSPRDRQKSRMPSSA